MAIALYLAYSTSTDLTIQCSGLDTLSANAKELDWECWNGSTLVSSKVTYVSGSSTDGYCSFSGLTPSTTYSIHCDVFDQSPTVFLDDADNSFSTDAIPTTFACTITALSSTTVSVSAIFQNGSETNHRRFIRVEIGSQTVDIDANEQGGTDNTFAGTISGLTDGQTYSWVCTLGYRGGGGDSDKHLSSYTDSGTVVMPQGTTVYIWDGTAWKPATPYIWDGTAWQPATAYIWDGTGWKPQ